MTAERFSAGPHELTWDGRSERGRAMPDGIYFGRLQAGATATTSKMVLRRE